MHNFRDIEFPDSDGDNVLKSIGVSDGVHNKLFTKFLDSAKGVEKKSRVIRCLMKYGEFSEDEMKLIFLLAYDRATAIIQESAEKVFKK